MIIKILTNTLSFLLLTVSLFQQCSQHRGLKELVSSVCCQWMQCNNLNKTAAKGTDPLKITYTSNNQNSPAIKMFLLSAFLGRSCAELHLTFYISKQSQKHGFTTVWGEPFNRIQRKWKWIKSQHHGGYLVQLESWTRLLLPTPGLSISMTGDPTASLGSLCQC